MPVSRLAAVIAIALVSTAAIQQVVRTGDPAKRGLSEANFPRVQKLADGVYWYEQLRSAGSELFTTVSLFVVTSAGVVVADGQGSVAETRRMIDEIAKVTPAADHPRRSSDRITAITPPATRRSRPT